MFDDFSVVQRENLGDGNGIQLDIALCNGGAGEHGRLVSLHNEPEPSPMAVLSARIPSVLRSSVEVMEASILPRVSILGLVYAWFLTTHMQKIVRAARMEGVIGEFHARAAVIGLA